jgi:hypothetical protein
MGLSSAPLFCLAKRLENGDFLLSLPLLFPFFGGEIKSAKFSRFLFAAPFP